MNRLQVIANGTVVGVLSTEGGSWRFDYADHWQAWPLAPGFPLATRSFQDNGGVRPIEWFFENLLPEGRLRDMIASRERIATSDTWALLTRHGCDTAGALSLLPEGINPAAGRLVALPKETLQAKIMTARAQNLPLMAAWDEIRMSLAGAQEKLGLTIDASGAMFLPEGASPSTHIVKPGNVSAMFPFCPANEFFCMRLAHVLQLPVPLVDLLHLPEPLYVIERFDRTKAANGAIQRLHQIDLCQTMGVAASKKYESEGGLGLEHLFAVLRGSLINRPIVAANVLIQWIAFNYLIGNLDAHAKNIAFLLNGPKATVAPFYDLLCVEAYLPRQTMAMAIAGENKPGWVEGMHWDAMAYEAGVAPRLVRDMLARLVTALPDAIAGVIRDDRLLVDERDFLQKKVVPVIDERCRFVAAALSARPAALAQILRMPGLDSAVLQRLAHRR
jgi:serine/threonine-protein kinase HipA